MAGGLLAARPGKTKSSKRRKGTTTARFPKVELADRAGLVAEAVRVGVQLAEVFRVARPNAKPKAAARAVDAALGFSSAGVGRRHTSQASRLDAAFPTSVEAAAKRTLAKRRAAIPRRAARGRRAAGRVLDGRVVER